MVICPKCNIEYEAGKKFCKVCGSFLLNEEGHASIQRTDFRRVWRLHLRKKKEGGRSKRSNPSAKREEKSESRDNIQWNV
jgi:hypothetical protein